MKDKVLDFLDKILELPANQFWVCVLGLFFFSYVILGAIGTIGLLLIAPMVGAACYLVFERCFMGRDEGDLD